MKLIVVRHGETEWSAALKHTSRTDLPLTEAGRRTAVALGEQLRGRCFALVLCSPLLRARETCELAGFNADAILCEDLHEWNYGDYEGLTTAQVHARAPGWSLWRDGCPNGESPREVALRVDRVLNRLDAEDAEDAGGEAVAFAHGHVLRVLAARWIGMEAAAGARFALGAGAVGVLGHERETEVIERWNA
ncbi:MAG: histidine phosphatase family protein [Solirubrobacteraceae bacterium]